MGIEEIATILEGEICVHSDAEVHFGAASDLMSDVLTLDGDDIVLLTGLATVQTLRTAEMADIPLVVVLRGKRIDDEMLALAAESEIGLIRTPMSMFQANARLFNAGLKPMY